MRDAQAGFVVYCPLPPPFHPPSPAPPPPTAMSHRKPVHTAQRKCRPHCCVPSGGTPSHPPEAAGHRPRCCVTDMPRPRPSPHHARPMRRQRYSPTLQCVLRRFCSTPAKKGPLPRCRRLPRHLGARPALSPARTAANGVRAGRTGGWGEEWEGAWMHVGQATARPPNGEKPGAPCSPWGRDGSVERRAHGSSPFARPATPVHHNVLSQLRRVIAPCASLFWSSVLTKKKKKKTATRDTDTRLLHPTHHCHARRGRNGSPLA